MECYSNKNHDRKPMALDSLLTRMNTLRSYLLGGITVKERVLELLTNLLREYLITIKHFTMLMSIISIYV